MTSEAIYALLDVHEWESEVDRSDSPLTPEQRVASTTPTDGRVVPFLRIVDGSG
jgi:hypothetical protein